MNNVFVEVEVYDTANATGFESLEKFESKHKRTFQINFANVVYLTAADEELQDDMFRVRGHYATLVLTNGELIISAKSEDRLKNSMARLNYLQGLR